MTMFSHRGVQTVDFDDSLDVSVDGKTACSDRGSSERHSFVSSFTMTYCGTYAVSLKSIVEKFERFVMK
jgi:hypothetical protein